MMSQLGSLSHSSLLNVMARAALYSHCHLSILSQCPPGESIRILVQAAMTMLNLKIIRLHCQCPSGESLVGILHLLQPGERLMVCLN